MRAEEIIAESALVCSEEAGPANRWFNWFYAHNAWDDGDPKNPAHDPTPYPSKDVAEAIAERQLLKHPSPELITYLGAFREGVRPPAPEQGGER